MYEDRSISNSRVLQMLNFSDSEAASQRFNKRGVLSPCCTAVLSHGWPMAMCLRLGFYDVAAGCAHASCEACACS